MHRLACLLFVVGLLGLPQVATAQVAFDAATASSAVSASSVTFSHTVTGTNTFLLVSCGHRFTQTTTAVTYNGVAMTLERREGPNSNNTVDVYRLVNPATGANFVAATFSGSDDAACIAASFTGVNQTTPIGTSVGDQSAGDHAHDTTNETNGIVWDALDWQVTATVTPNGGQTTRATTAAFGAGNLIGTTKPGATTVNTGYTIGGGQYFVHITVPIKPAAAGGGGRRTLLLLGAGQ